jgi:hypothetical protein
VRQYIAGLPAEIEDAARLDGASEWYILFKIVMPLSKPILVVLAIYAFLGNWNSFLFPFLFTNDESMRTLPVGLAFYLGKQSIDWGHLMAGYHFKGEGEISSSGYVINDESERFDEEEYTTEADAMNALREYFHQHDEAENEQYIVVKVFKSK